MMKLAEPYISEGDVVVLAPELNAQTYSTYTGYDAAWKCFENMGYPHGKFSLDESMNYFFHYFKYVVEKGQANIVLNAPYDKASFNEYGDIDNEIVNQNILENYYDATQLIEPNLDLLDSDFIKEVNTYNKALNKKNASLYFSFSPTNELALIDENLVDFENQLKEKLNCPILGSVKEFTYHEYYFYDTNFHLNRAGSYNHSKKLAELLNKELNVTSSYEIPSKERPVPKFFHSGIIEEYKGILYEQMFTNNRVTYALFGFTESKKNIEDFTVPETVNGYQVSSIALHAFKDMPNIITVTIPKTVEDLMQPLFENCPKVYGLYLEHEMPIPVCSTGLVDGASSGCKIYIKSEYYSAFMHDYTWVNYRTIMVSY